MEFAESETVLKSQNTKLRYFYRKVNFRSEFMKRNTLLTGLHFLLILAAGLWFIGCKGDKGPAGPAGVNPASAPMITSIVAMPDSLGTGQSTTLIVSAYDPNGDPITFEWSASAGHLTSPNTAATQWVAPDTMGLQRAIITVSDNHAGVTHDTIMLGVNTYVPRQFPCYLGDDANKCGACHSDIVAGWRTTHHAGAYDSLGADTSNTRALPVIPPAS
jgi:hypothetical protein